MFVTEIEGTFVEVETTADEESELAGALDTVRTVLRSLGVADEDRTRETYTDAVIAARR